MLAFAPGAAGPARAVQRRARIGQPALDLQMARKGRMGEGEVGVVAQRLAEARLCARIPGKEQVYAGAVGGGGLR